MANCPAPYYDSTGMFVIPICEGQELTLPDIPTSTPPPSPKPTPAGGYSVGSSTLNDAVTGLFERTRDPGKVSCDEIGDTARGNGSPRKLGLTGEAGKIVVASAYVKYCEEGNEGASKFCRCAKAQDDSYYDQFRTTQTTTSERDPRADISLAFAGNPMAYTLAATEAARAVEHATERLLLPRYITNAVRVGSRLLGLVGGLFFPEDIEDATVDPILRTRLVTDAQSRASTARAIASSDKRIVAPALRTAYETSALSTPTLQVEPAIATQTQLVTGYTVPDARGQPSSTKLASIQPTKTKPVGKIAGTDFDIDSLFSSPAAQRGRAAVPKKAVSTLLEDFTQPSLQPQKNSVDTSTKECVKDTKPRTQCWVTLTKERTDPTKDTVKRWRKIKCQ